MTAASAAAKYQADSEAAESQAAAVQQNRNAARMDAERLQQQEQEAAAASVNAHAMQAHKDMAAFDAIAGESGNSVSSQRGRAVMGIKQGQDLATITSNVRKGQQEIGFGDIASSNKSSQQAASIKQPSLTEAGLTIASAGVRYGTDMNAIKNAKG